MAGTQVPLASQPWAVVAEPANFLAGLPDQAVQVEVVAGTEAQGGLEPLGRVLMVGYLVVKLVVVVAALAR